MITGPQNPQILCIHTRTIGEDPCVWSPKKLLIKLNYGTLYILTCIVCSVELCSYLNAIVLYLATDRQT